MNSPQVSLLKETSQVGLAGFLESRDIQALESEALKGQVTDEQLGGLLLTADLTESDVLRPVAMGFLHTVVAGALLRAARWRTASSGPPHQHSYVQSVWCVPSL
ncbi:hypothetical protein CSKR_202707 [Clonorchis sinensis]|uniref:Uncharacterized protein n=1 Tax=Clonorchis sinensis TaxID=79923 RepID=A0A8T1M111_CLOSI|nr:hypothetical protein CSKR_202707 [Clonorchis sinensis]